MLLCCALPILSYYTLTSTNRIHCDNYFFNHGLRTPGESFFPKIWNFWSWADKLGIWGIFGQAISTMLALWVPCPWESVAGSLSQIFFWFLGLNHTTPKCSQNQILAVKNLGNSVHTSVFGVFNYLPESLEKSYWWSKKLESLNQSEIGKEIWL